MRKLVRESEMHPELIHLINERAFDAPDRGEPLRVTDLFTWSATPEGSSFWARVNTWQTDSRRDHTHLPTPFNVEYNPYVVYALEPLCH